MRLFVSLALFLLVPIASARAQDRAPADDAPAPRVRVLASGGLDVGALRQRLEALEARVGRCVPASSTDAWQLRLTVAPDGDVIAVADDGPSTDEDRARRRTARCLGRVFAAATLPRPSDGHARVRLRVTRRRAPAGVLGALRGGRGSALGSLGTAGAG
ncbi:MAG TPA: hypothetical protein RMH99_24280, partial [Sandaracinaceae bacterium LLY-WYZ-13_1]|nr:hypothetical protein [Sandaracinaceae bacterium LLY-WYZ-13_1]